MHLIPFSPFNELERLRRDVDDVFKSFDLYERPRVDVFEDEKEVKVVAEIPGISKDDIDITVYDDSVRITGEVKRSSELKEENIRRSERFYGKFTRTVPLPSEVKSDEARADYKDGVLTITIPKRFEAKSSGKKIKLS
ncbi:MULTISPECIES: Hsp20/alpha crystallin family protein [unclassified Caloramator]|nr:MULTISPECIES: Hsp20/alpha crystallin family protein [unclassified Caloramator]MDO6354956.1 Hsp20/alpha crystallin family protein [Caloramator sp. CAR-1]WDU82092.1 Hsp20/alpha crystallin family protein [Caloramator sp. Dgby_cultured_2]